MLIEFIVLVAIETITHTVLSKRAVTSYTGFLMKENVSADVQLTC